MSFLANTLNKVLGAAGLKLTRQSQSEHDARMAGIAERVLRRLDLDGTAVHERPKRSVRLPAGAEEYLRQDHPRLIELRDRYRRLNSPATRHSHWTPSFVEQEVGLREFRDDVAYVWQSRDLNAAPHYVATAMYAREHDRQNLLSKLTDDDLFGAQVHHYGDSLALTRDLLDSVLELSFLDRHTDLFRVDGINLLDIGAGYGRFGHRAAQGVPNLGKVVCTDAVAESTFLCEYYLGFRGVSGKAVTAPLDEIETSLQSSPVRIATNIHSFTECPLVAINWWLDRAASQEIPYLFIVPNASGTDGNRMWSHEASGPGHDFVPEILKRGYRLAVKEPKFLVPIMQRHGVTPTSYWLFAR